MTFTPFDRMRQEAAYSDSMRKLSGSDRDEHPIQHHEIEQFARSGELPHRFYKGNDLRGRPIPVFGERFSDLPQNLQQARLQGTGMSVADHETFHDVNEKVDSERGHKQAGRSGVSERTFTGGLLEDPNAGRRY